MAFSGSSWATTRQRKTIDSLHLHTHKKSRNKSPTLIKRYTMAHKFKSILSWFFVVLVVVCVVVGVVVCRECTVHRERKDSAADLYGADIVHYNMQRRSIASSGSFGTKNEIRYAVRCVSAVPVCCAHANVFIVQIELWPLEPAKRLLFGYMEFASLFGIGRISRHRRVHVPAIGHH